MTTGYAAWGPAGAARWVAYRERLLDPEAHREDYQVHLTLDDTAVAVPEPVWERLLALAGVYQLPLFTHQFEAPPHTDEPMQVDRQRCPAGRLLEELHVLEWAIADPLLRPVLAVLRQIVRYWPQAGGELTLRLADPDQLSEAHSDG